MLRGIRGERTVMDADVEDLELEFLRGQCLEKSEVAQPIQE